MRIWQSLTENKKFPSKIFYIGWLAGEGWVSWLGVAAVDFIYRQEPPNKFGGMLYCALIDKWFLTPENVTNNIDHQIEFGGIFAASINHFLKESGILATWSKIIKYTTLFYKKPLTAQRYRKSYYTIGINKNKQLRSTIKINFYIHQDFLFLKTFINKSQFLNLITKSKANT